MPETRDGARSLYCCCCGGRTTGRQWWNQDTGHGLCPACADRIAAKGVYTPDEFARIYGERGTHYAVEGA